MKIFIDISKYFAIGIGIGILVFMPLFLSHYFIENKGNKFETQIYLEVLDLYKAEVLTDIKWTKVFTKLFVPESVIISVISNYNDRFRILESPYQRVENYYPMYLIRRGETVFSIEFKEQMDIGIWE